MKWLNYAFLSLVVVLPYYARSQTLNVPPVLDGTDVDTVSIDGIRLGDSIASLLERDPIDSSKGTYSVNSQNIQINLNNEWSTYSEYCRQQFWEGNKIDKRKLSKEQLIRLSDAFTSGTESLAQTSVPASFFYSYIDENSSDSAEVKIVYNQQNGIVTDIAYRRSYPYDYEEVAKALKARFNLSQFYDFKRGGKQLYVIQARPVTNFETAMEAQSMHGTFNSMRNPNNEYPDKAMLVMLSGGSGNGNTSLQIMLSTQSDPKDALETLKKSCVNANREVVDAVMSEVKDAPLSL